MSDPRPEPESAPDFPRRASRIGFELPVRCSLSLTRSTVMLKDMNRFGARIEGIDAGRVGEPITLLLPGQAARMAFIVWSRGMSSGLEFADPLHEGVFETLIRDYAITKAVSPTAHGPIPTPMAA